MGGGALESDGGGVIITDELDRRPSRSPDYAAENRALNTLAEAMSIDPDTVLQHLVELAMELTHSESAGISLLEPGGDEQVFRWVATTGAWSSYRDGTIPADASPCGEVIARDTVLLMKTPERAFPALQEADAGISEGLLVPFYLGGVPVGTLWAVKHHPDGQFEAEDARILKCFARFASAAQQTVNALQMARAASQQAEVRVQQLIVLAELSTEFFGTCDMEFMPIYGNAAAMKMVGLVNLDQVKRTPVLEFFFPEDQAFITEEFFPRVIREGYGKIETRFRHFVTGEPVWVVYSVVVLKDKMGRPTGFGTVTHEITERKIIEERLRTSEIRYRRLFEAAHDGVLILDPDTQKIIDANPFMTKLLGYSHDELVGKELFQIGFLGEAQASRDMFETLKAIRQVRYENLPLRSQEGVAREVEVVANLYDEDGRTVVQCNVRDISERKRAERILKEVEDRQKLVLEACRIGTFHGDLRSGEAQWNSVEFELLGLEDGAAPPGLTTFFRYVHPDDLAALQSTWEKGTESGARDSEFRIIRADGEERWLVVRGVILPDDDAQSGVEQQQRFLGVNFDITERKRAEEHAQVLMAEVNHRARNLLAVVQAVAHQTAKLGDPQTFAARLSDRINGLAANQDLLVKNLWHGVEVTELVLAQLAHFKDLIGSRIYVQGPELMLTAAASQAVGMALHELSTNAAKYGALSNSTGEVRIEWRTCAGPNSVFSMSWVESEGPTVTAPTRTGFGQTVIKRLVEIAVGGKVEIDYAAKGLSWQLQTPVSNALVLSKGGLSCDVR